MDAKVLSFGDVLLRECDVATLEPSQWLNDKIIEFYFEYLSRTLLGASDPSASAAGAGAAAGTASSSAGGESSSNGAGGGAGAAAGGEGNNSAVLLVGPSVSFWLNICPSDDDVTETMAPLGVENKEVRALRTLRGTASGCHWVEGGFGGGGCMREVERRQAFGGNEGTAVPVHSEPSHSASSLPPRFLVASWSLPGRFLVASSFLLASSSLPPRFLLIASFLASYNAAPDASATKSAHSVPSSFKISFLTASLSSPPLPISSRPLIALAVNGNNDPTLSVRQAQHHLRSTYPPSLPLSLPSPSPLASLPSVLSVALTACLVQHILSWQLIALAVNGNNDPTLVQCCSFSLPPYPLPLSLCLPLRGSSSPWQSTTTTTPHSQRQARTGVSSSSSGQLGLVPLPLQQHTSVAVPHKVNSHTLVEAGSHWSLLLFIRSARAGVMLTSYWPWDIISHDCFFSYKVSTNYNSTLAHMPARTGAC
ncbi:unnamed protein product [Closterium sp. NIES-53]